MWESVAPIVKQEVRRFGSRNIDQSLMYPGTYCLTWVKLPFMPWSLASIEAVDRRD